MSFTWLIFAFSGPVLWAISTHLDKFLLDRYFKDVHPAVSLAFTGVINLIALPVFWAIDPRIFDIGFHAIALMTLSGMLLMTAMLFYMMALKYNEASEVAPFFQASPLFGVALGLGVVGERLSGTQWIGVILTLTGAFAAGTGDPRRPHHGLVLLMLTCAVMVALSSLIFKIFAVHEDFWPTTFWMFVGQTIVALAILTVGELRRELIGMLRAHTEAVIGINAINEVINLIGSLGLRYALVLAPLSLVQAVSSTTSVFVFIFGVIITLVAPKWGSEDISRKAILRKGSAAALVSIGIGLLGTG